MTTRAEKAIPKRIRRRSTIEELIARLDQVMDENSRFVHVCYTPDEYADARSAKNSLQTSAERYDYPLIFHVRNGELHAERTDM